MIQPPVNEKAVLGETYWGWRRQRASGVCALLSGRQSRLKGCLSSFRRDCRTAASQIFSNTIPFFFSFFALTLPISLLHCAQPLQPLRQWILKPWGWFETRLETRAGKESLLSHRLPDRCHGNAEGLIHFGSVPSRPLGPHAVPLWHRATFLVAETKHIKYDQNHSTRLTSTAAGILAAITNSSLVSNQTTNKGGEIRLLNSQYCLNHFYYLFCNPTCLLECFVFTCTSILCWVQ